MYLWKLYVHNLIYKTPKVIDVVYIKYLFTEIINIFKQIELTSMIQLSLMVFSQIYVTKLTLLVVKYG